MAMNDCKFPLVQELPTEFSAVDAFRRCAHLPYCLFLDSARQGDALGRYSFVAADPFDVTELSFEEALGGVHPFAELEPRLQAFRTPHIDNLPPFQGGLAGVFSYELAHCFEKVPLTRYREFDIPVLTLGWYDVVFAFDHQENKGWLISHGAPETDDTARHELATKRLANFADLASQPPSGWNVESWRDSERPVLNSTELSPQHSVGDLPGLTSDFSADQYQSAVRRAVEHIHAGDIFQVNLSQRLLVAQTEDPRDLYLRLRQQNPAPFAGYFDAGSYQLASASPERFLRCWSGDVEARPIKGTRRRTSSAVANLYSADELSASEKDRAENVMIVDLMRNDLSRSCLDESVIVDALCRLETYQYVQHLVSVVRGQLREDSSPLQLLAGAFPGGSITGAPKVRAMEIIADIEPTARGPYCGSLGYLGFDGWLDLSILIRSITVSQGWQQAAVGGGIVSQSQPRNEYEETWHKATGMLRAMQK